MTKEELKQEAEEKCVCTDEAMRIMYRIGYIDGAEPREKRIAELEDKLANADYQLEGRDLEIRELKAQIEKMKCCENCQTVRDAEGNCYLKKDGKCKDKDKWELRR